MLLKPGQVAIVTGAANGVGLSLSRLLLEKGLQVVMIDNDPEALAEAGEALQSAGTVTGFKCDISDRAAVQLAEEAISARYPDVHLLINNAGVSADAPFLTQELEDFRWVMETNFFGAVNMCKYFLPRLVAAGEAHIVNVASAAAIFGFPGKTAYCASKSALKGFSQALRVELDEVDVGVTLAYLGPVDTDMITRSRVSDVQRRNQMQDYLHEKGMKPDDVARSILRAVEKNKVGAHISKESKILGLLDRIAPNSFLRLMTKFQDKLPA